MKLADRVLAFIEAGGVVQLRKDGAEILVQAPGDRELVFQRDTDNNEKRGPFIARALSLAMKRSAA